MKKINESALEFLRIQFDNDLNKFVAYWSRGQDHAKFYADTFQDALRTAYKNLEA